jgi:RNA polymerase sigma-70 factor (ECF subfamily)
MSGDSQPGGTKPALTEPQLIARIRAGEAKLFHELLRPYERALYHSVFAILRNPQDSEEVVQDAVLKAFQSLSGLRDDEKFKSWLLRIAINEAQMRRRKYRRAAYESIDGSDVEDARYTPKQYADWRDLPSDFVEREEFRAGVRRAIEELPDIYREIYVLTDGQSLSMEDVAQVLGITVASAKTRLHRARLMIQEKLSPVFKPSMMDMLRMMKGMNPWSRAKR